MDVLDFESETNFSTDPLGDIPQNPLSAVTSEYEAATSAQKPRLTTPIVAMSSDADSRSTSGLQDENILPFQMLSITPRCSQKSFDRFSGPPTPAAAVPVSATKRLPRPSSRSNQKGSAKKERAETKRQQQAAARTSEFKRMEDDLYKQMGTPQTEISSEMTTPSHPILWGQGYTAGRALGSQARRAPKTFFERLLKAVLLFATALVCITLALILHMIALDESRASSIPYGAF